MRNLRIVILLSLLGLGSSLSACNYNIDKTGGTGRPGQPSAGSGAPGSGSAADPTLNWDFVFQNAIRPNCFGCHAAPRNASGVNLETYENVFALRAAIENAVSTRFMPESMGRTMPDDQRALLLNWLAAGAPFATPVGGNPQNPSPPQPIPPTNPQPNPPSECGDDRRGRDHCDDDHNDDHDNNRITEDTV